MKSFIPFSLFIPCLTALLISCQETLLINDPYLVEENLTTRASDITNDFFVSLQEAEYYVGLMYPECEISTIEPVVIENDTLVYLINFIQGWTAIAADKRVPPILGEDAYSELHLDQETIGPLVWLNSCAYDILAMQESGKEHENDNTDLWSFIKGEQYYNGKEIPSTRGADDRWAVFLIDSYTDNIINQVNHLVSTKWGQGSPWHQKLPTDSNYNNNRCQLGCVPVAMAQLIYYYKNKFSLSLGFYHTVGCSLSSISGPSTNVGFFHGDFTSNSSRWSQMSLTEYDISSHSTEYPGDLMLELGHEFNALYSGFETYVSSSFSPYNVFHDYGIDCISSSYSYNTTKSNLDNGLPLMVSAYTSPNATSGHCWIIDGYREITEQYVNRYLLIYTDQYEGAIATYTNSQVEEVFGEYYYDGMEWDDYFVYDTVKRLYMNWGYNGAYDSGTYLIVPGADWRNYGYNTIIYYDFASL